jgi:hypothetical protein
MARNIAAAICGAVLAAACATPRTSGYNAIETAEVYAATYCPEVPFTALSYCVRSRFDTVYPRWRSDANADLVNIFLAWSDAAAAHVADGTLNEAQARQRADALEARLDQILDPSPPVITTPQYRPPSVPRPIVCSVMGSGQFATAVCH